MRDLELFDAGTVAGSQDTPEGRTKALEYLQGIYNDPTQSTSMRMRAAIECLPFEVPKLSASAIVTTDGKSFAEALERALVRSDAVRSRPALPPPVIDATVIDAAPVVTPEEMKRPFARPNYRRF